MSQLSDLIQSELLKILPGLRRDLESEFYKRNGLLPSHEFYSDNRLLRVFNSEAGRYFVLTGHKESEAESFISINYKINEEQRRIIYRIATLALVQLAMW